MGETYLAILGCFFGGALVVEVLEVLVNGEFLGLLVLVKHGGNSTSRFGRLAMQGFVELGISLAILSLEASRSSSHCVKVVGRGRKELDAIEEIMQNVGSRKCQVQAQVN